MFTVARKILAKKTFLETFLTNFDFLYNRKKIIINKEDIIINFFPVLRHVGQCKFYKLEDNYIATYLPYEIDYVKEFLRRKFKNISPH